jgi:hypothetical protein
VAGLGFYRVGVRNFYRIIFWKIKTCLTTYMVNYV